MNTVVALFAALALLAPGLGAWNTECGRACCCRAGTQLGASGCSGPCCALGAAVGAGEPDAPGWAKDHIWAAGPSFAIRGLALGAPQAVVTLPGSPDPPVPLYALECALRL